MADSDRQTSKQPPWHQAPDQESVSFGAWLRHQREARGIELRDIADHTKISIRYLEALEVDRFDLLPAPVFTKGFLRQYGRYIGLDPDQVVNTYLNALHEGDAGQSEEPSEKHGIASERWFGALLVAGAVILLALVAYLTFRADRSDGVESNTRPGIAAPPVQPVEVDSEAEAIATQEAVLQAPLIVTLFFVDDSWVETTVDGERQLSEQVAKGESRRIYAEQRVVLSLGNREGVLVEVNGESFVLPATDGAPSDDIEITLASIANSN